MVLWGRGGISGSAREVMPVRSVMLARSGAEVYLRGCLRGFFFMVRSPVYETK